MNEMLNYLIEANLTLALLYICYWLLFRSENQFSFKRIYLLASVTASLLFPLISIQTNGTQVIPSISNTQAVVLLPELTVNDAAANMPIEQPTSIWQWLPYFYFAGLILFSLVFVARVLSLIRLFRNSRKYNWKNYKVAESEKIDSSFSFFHMIFIGQPNKLTEQEKEAVLIHEEAHIKKYHSIDIVLLNVLGTVFWFNPIVHLYKNSLVQIHEFEADAHSIEGRDVNAYCSLLAKVALESNGYPLANHFTNSFTLKRIEMIKKIKNRIRIWKVIASSFAALLIFIAVACQDQVDSTSANDKEQASTKDYPPALQSELNKLQKVYPETKFEIIKYEDYEKNKENLKSKYPEYFSTNAKGNPIISTIVVVKEGESFENFLIIGENSRQKRINSLPKQEDGIYTMVDEIASPIFGYEMFYQHILHTINYPADARKQGLEGKVFIEFIVETNGEISDASVLKGISHDIDQEAIRAFFQVRGKWNPAVLNNSVVRQKLVIPINFQLAGTDKKTETGSINKPTLDEIVVVGQKPKEN